MTDEVPLAATVLLLRDGVAGLEVLMIARHAESVFAGGAWVFPGGRLDPGDSAPEILRCCAEVAGADAAEMALRVCGIRETFEEARLLLARPIGRETLLTGSRACRDRGAARRQARSLAGFRRARDRRWGRACHRSFGALRALDHARRSGRGGSMPISFSRRRPRGKRRAMTDKRRSHRSGFRPPRPPQTAPQSASR